ncbi:MAG: ABC transporter substrate-binding protein [Methanothrix soehngenii]|uniref:ABC transporter substrate-binding protein n=1 Tax=Methanothrix soehngenii TaxID=2223 RepID=UPI0023F2EB66|nr:ABC transporter substrate-binding protein [Methanothrix soehngenii]MDD5256925.1 ABC transporter substrate-binding protein [Methanothrix soehngenii]
MKWLIYTLILALFVSSAIAPAFAKGIDVPGDSNGDKIVSTEEQKAAEKLSQEGQITKAQLEEIKNIHENYPKTITDSANQMVTIYKPIQRAVIAYWIDAAITLQALKAEDSIIDITAPIAEQQTLFPKLSRLPVVGEIPRVESLDFEKILELEPDVVITGENASTWDAIQEKIQSLDPDVAVIRFDYAEPETYLDEVNKTGYLFDKKEEANELIDFIDGHLTQINERVKTIPSDARTTVYCEVFSDYKAGGRNYIELAGGANIFGNTSQETFTTTPEEIITRNPEVILHLMGWKYAGKIGWEADNVTAMREKRDEIMSRTGFTGIDAVKSGRVYALDSNIVMDAIYPVGICYFAKWFYPDLFKDMDPNAIHQEYLSKFLGIDYDLSKRGEFVYHPEQHPDGR